MEECIGYNGENTDGDNTLTMTASIIYCDKHCSSIFSVPYNSDEADAVSPPVLYMKKLTCNSPR